MGAGEGEERERVQTMHLLVYFQSGHNGQNWAGQNWNPRAPSKLPTWVQWSKDLSHAVLPSQANREQLVVEQLRHEAAPIHNASTWQMEAWLTMTQG